MNVEVSDEDSDELALLTKNFNKFMRKIGKKVDVNSSRGKRFSNPSESIAKHKKIQCREYGGHIQPECANILKKKSKVMTFTWSDNDSVGSQEENIINNIAFVISNSHFDMLKKSCCIGIANTVSCNTIIINDNSVIE